MSALLDKLALQHANASNTTLPGAGVIMNVVVGIGKFQDMFKDCIHVAQQSIAWFADSLQCRMHCKG